MANCDSVTESVMTKYKSHFRVEIKGLQVNQELLGTSHNFSYKDYMIEVRMPVTTETSKVEIAATRAVEDEILPVYSRVNIVDIYVDIPEALECINDEDNNNVSLNHGVTGCEPDKLIQIMTSISIGAFKQWVDIVRFVTGNYSIGHQPSYSMDSFEEVSIVESMSEKTVCRGSICFNGILVQHSIDNKAWREIQSKLTENFFLPIHYQFLIDASHALTEKRLKSCIIDLAMACETYIRYSVFEVLGECPEDIKSNLELSNINSFNNGYFKDRVVIAQQNQYNKLKVKNLSSLFDARNKLVHMGVKERVTHENCIRFIKTTRELFTIKLSNNSNT